MPAQPSDLTPPPRATTGCGPACFGFVSLYVRPMGKGWPHRLADSKPRQPQLRLSLPHSVSSQEGSCSLPLTLIVSLDRPLLSTPMLESTSEEASA